MNNALKIQKQDRPKPALKLVKTNDLMQDDWPQRFAKAGWAVQECSRCRRSQSLQRVPTRTLDGENWPRLPASPKQTPTTKPAPCAAGARYWNPAVAAHYTKRTGHKVRRINAVLQHPAEPWMLANLDREVVGVPDVQILECKTAGMNGARLWRDGVPEYIQLQVLHQLAVTGKQAADVAVLICGQELQVHRIERNEPMIKQVSCSWSASSGIYVEAWMAAATFGRFRLGRCGFACPVSERLRQDHRPLQGPGDVGSFLRPALCSAVSGSPHQAGIRGSSSAFSNAWAKPANRV